MLGFKESQSTIEVDNFVCSHLVVGRALVQVLRQGFVANLDLVVDGVVLVNKVLDFFDDLLNSLLQFLGSTKAVGVTSQPWSNL